MAGENRKMRKLTCAAMVVVTAATVFMVKGFLDQANTAVQAQAQRNMQSVHDAADQPGETGSEAGQADGIPALTAADYAAAQDFVAKYAGEWNVQMYYNGEEWKIYELGKRMAIMGYNYLNDVEFTTGGYDKLVGFNNVTEKVVIAGTNEVLEERVVDMVPVYEYVPEKRHKLLPGEDIEYSTPSITLSDQGVDMSGMGGPVFYLEGFRVETIGDERSGKKEYLINDYFDFAIAYDGEYLEYCEPTISGDYQGYYAFE